MPGTKQYNTRSHVDENPRITKIVVSSNVANSERLATKYVLRVSASAAAAFDAGLVEFSYLASIDDESNDRRQGKPNELTNEQTAKQIMNACTSGKPAVFPPKMADKHPYALFSLGLSRVIVLLCQVYVSVLVIPSVHVSFF